MLVRLHVANFRVVEDLAFSPGEGLSVITGETGAGKSVLVGALEAVLGHAMNAEDVRPPANSASVSATFLVSPSSPVWPHVNELLPDWHGPELTVERRLHRNGRSSCRVSGRVVSREAQAAIGDWLIDIHGQHGHQLLLSPAAQLDMLDGFGGLLDGRRELAERYRMWMDLRRRLRDAREAAERARLESERRHFELGELRAANLVPDEHDQLDEELRFLASAQRWKAVCMQARETLLDGDDAVIGRAVRVLRALDGLGERFPDLQRTLSGAQRSLVELQELADSIRRIDSKLEADPERQGEVEERLGLLIRLEKKHGVTHEGLLGLLTQLEREASALEDSRSELTRLEAQLEEVRGDLEERATRLSMGRIQAAERLAPAVEAEFAALELSRARFAVRLEPQPVRDGFSGDSRGKERAVFLFCASGGEEPRELSKVASGGELSRIMLALKTVLGGVDPVDTMVFDEIDTGVGGGLARVVGERLKALGATRQVLCVTHLAPVAATAHSHFVVEKASRDRIEVSIREVSGEGRIVEIARMLGGLPITEEARRHAQVMVEGGAGGDDP